MIVRKLLAFSIFPKQQSTCAMLIQNVGTSLELQNTRMKTTADLPALNTDDRSLGYASLYTGCQRPSPCVDLSASGCNIARRRRGSGLSLNLGHLPTCVACKAEETSTKSKRQTYCWFNYMADIITLLSLSSKCSTYDKTFPHVYLAIAYIVGVWCIIKELYIY